MSFLSRVLDRKARLALLLGPAWAVPFVGLATASSPAAALALLAGGAVAAAMLLQPFFAFLLTAFVVPLERVGRLTDDSAVYSLSLMKIIGAIAMASLLMHGLLGRRRFHLSRPLLWYSGYVAFGVLTLGYTTDVTNGLRALSLVLGNVLFFFLVTNIVVNRRHAELAIASWLLSTLLIGLVTMDRYHDASAIVSDSAYYQGSMNLTTENRFDFVVYDALVDSPERSKRAIGTTSHPAVYGINLLLALPYYAYFFRTAATPWLRRLAAFGGLVACYNVILTNTRASLLAMMFMGLLILVSGLLRLRTKALLLMAALSVPAASIAIPSDVWRRAFNASIYSLQVAENRERITMWKAAGEVVLDHWLVGVGMGNTKEVPKRAGNRTTVSSPHNDLLAILVETGLVGFTLMAGFLLSVHSLCRSAESRLRRQGDPNTPLLLVATRLSIYLVLLFGLQAETLSLPLKGFWLSVGIAVALSQHLRAGRDGPVPVPPRPPFK